MQAAGDGGLGGVEESDPQRPGTTASRCTQMAWGQNTPPKSLPLSLPHRPRVDTCREYHGDDRKRALQTPSTEAQLPLKHKVFMIRSHSADQDHSANFKTDPDFMDENRSSGGLSLH